MRPGDANRPKHASREPRPGTQSFGWTPFRSHTVRASAASFRRRPEPGCAVGADFGYGQGPTGARSPSPLGSGLRRNDEVRRPRQGLGARPPQSRETSVNELSDIYNSSPLAIGAHRTMQILDYESAKHPQGGEGSNPRRPVCQSLFNYALSNASSGLDGFQLQNDQVRRRPATEERTCDRVLISRPPCPVSFVECHRRDVLRPRRFPVRLSGRSRLPHVQVRCMRGRPETAP